MSKDVNRRAFMNAAGIAAATGLVVPSALAADEAVKPADKVLIIGVACSPRKGKTTATAVQTALDAAKAVNSSIETHLIDLGGMVFSGMNASGEFGEDDFQRFVLPKLREPKPAGLIIGSPVYFRNFSSTCMAFLERLAVLRKPSLLLAGIPMGVLTVGAYRNGGQELVISQIQAAMLCHEAVIVGGKPGAHQGATLWNNYNDDITKDEFGIDSAKKLGIRVAEAALKLA